MDSLGLLGALAFSIINNQRSRLDIIKSDQSQHAHSKNHVPWDFCAAENEG
jgi:hypothetical protein